MTAIAASLVLLVDVMSVVIVGLAAAGVLRRNSIAGIRTGATRRTDESWQRSHRAAFVPVLLGAIVSVVLGVLALVLANAAPVPAGISLAGSIAGLVAGGAWGVVRARRAALQ